MVRLILSNLWIGYLVFLYAKYTNYKPFAVFFVWGAFEEVVFYIILPALFVGIAIGFERRKNSNTVT